MIKYREVCMTKRGERTKGTLLAWHQQLCNLGEGKDRGKVVLWPWWLTPLFLQLDSWGQGTHSLSSFEDDSEASSTAQTNLQLICQIWLTWWAQSVEHCQKKEIRADCECHRASPASATIVDKSWAGPGSPWHLTARWRGQKKAQAAACTARQDTPPLFPPHDPFSLTMWRVFWGMIMAACYTFTYPLFPLSPALLSLDPVHWFIGAVFGSSDKREHIRRSVVSQTHYPSSFVITLIF